MDTELALEIIFKLGEEKVHQVYELAKSVPVSFAMLEKIIRRQKLLADIRAGGKSIEYIAKKNKVSKRTVYRAI